MTNALLEDRVAIVTGGGRGIGRAIAARLAAQGARVIIADNGASIDGRTCEPGVADKAAAEIGAQALAFDRDMSTPGAAAEAVALAVERFGAVDILVHAAAILRDAMIFKGDPADFDAVIRTNLSAAYYLVNAAGPQLRAQAKAGRAGGRILLLTSSAGFYGNVGVAPYAAAKAGLLGLMRVAAHDLARSGVTANAIMPFAATRVTEGIPAVTDTLKAYRERALKVPAEPVAVMASYLASDLGASVTGQLFGVRGREVFLMSQPRPVARTIAPEGGWSESALAEAVSGSLAPSFFGMETDLEAFNIDPVL
ncbi:MAG: SDR family oxidoreductase [Alphaproteobacteria bacterium]|nr:MAG: SDR family oxidoreductase [Alphaproteobacteria bacterium]